MYGLTNYEGHIYNTFREKTFMHIHVLPNSCTGVSYPEINETVYFI